MPFAMFFFIVLSNMFRVLKSILIVAQVMAAITKERSI